MNRKEQKKIIKDGGNKIKMVDIKKALESEYLTIDYIKSSENKQMVILDGGDYLKGDFGEKLTIKVNLNNEIKIWNPNKESVKNLRKGKENIICRPGNTPEPVE